MNYYILIIKLHLADYPDWESETEAKNRKEAIEIFYGQLKGEFDRKFIDSQMGRVYKNGKLK